MAVTNYKKQEETARETQAMGSQTPYAYICPLPPEPPSHLPPHLNAILMHAYGIWNDGADKPICRAAVEMQT